MKKNIIVVAVAAALISVGSFASSSEAAVQNIALASEGQSYTTNSDYVSNYDPSVSYTGLVVDCRGLALQRAMSPVVKSATGESIYGAKNLDYAFVTRHGSADYSNDIERIRRAGSTPLFVKAESLMNHGTYPVVSAEDARNILAADSRTGFLKATNVVFLY